MNAEWKCIHRERPEISKWYVVVNGAGERSIRRYDLLYTQGLGAKKVIPVSRVKGWDWGWKHYECAKQIPFEGFIKGDNYLCADPIYFMELPELPEMSELDKCKSELLALKQKIKMLENANAH